MWFTKDLANMRKELHHRESKWLRSEGGDDHKQMRFSTHAWKALRYYEAVSTRILTAEVLTHVGLLAIIVAYAPTNQASEEMKDQFYADFDEVMTKTNGLTMVLGDFNASLGDNVPGIDGPH